MFQKSRDGQLPSLLEIERAHLGDAAALATLSSFPAITVGRFRDAVDIASGRIVRSGGSPTRSIRVALSEASLSFHRTADTLTPTVAAAISRLASGAPILLFAHQPIAFPYDGVTGQIHLMSAIQRALREAGHDVVSVHLVVDTDDAREPYFRTSRIPSPNVKSGAQGTPLPVGRQKVAMFDVGLPGWDSFEGIIARSHANLMQLRSIGRSLGIVRQHPDDGELVATLRHAHHHAGSLARFSASALSFVANVRCEYDTIFASYSDLLPAIAGEVVSSIELVERLGSGSDRPAAAGFAAYPALGAFRPYWRKCERCTSRNPISQEIADRCWECGAPLGGSSASIQDLVERGLIYPRVVVDDLLFGSVIRPALSVSYLSSADHVLRSYGLFQHFADLSPHLLWRPRPIRGSLAELISLRMLGRTEDSAARRAISLSLMGRGSMIYGLRETSPAAAAALWQAHWNGGASFSDPCWLLSPSESEVVEASLLARLETESIKLLRSEL